MNRITIVFLLIASFVFEASAQNLANTSIKIGASVGDIPDYYGGEGFKNGTTPDINPVFGIFTTYFWWNERLGIYSGVQTQISSSTSYRYRKRSRPDYAGHYDTEESWFSQQYNIKKLCFPFAFTFRAIKHRVWTLDVRAGPEFQFLLQANGTTIRNSKSIDYDRYTGQYVMTESNSTVSYDLIHDLETPIRSQDLRLGFDLELYYKQRFSISTSAHVGVDFIGIDSPLNVETSIPNRDFGLALHYFPFAKASKKSKP